MVQFCAGQGECAETLRFYAPGEALGSLPAAQLSGYAFLGWQTESGALINASCAVPREGLILYAAYEKEAKSERGEQRD